VKRETGRSEVTAAEQLQKSHPRHNARVQPLPSGSPGRAAGEDVGIDDPGEGISFFVIGDHGGVKSPGPQNAVSYAMQKAIGADDAFVYSVGDIVYFYGERWEYPHQFYEPYAHIPVPILGIPGNHDGDIKGEHTERQPLDGFMANFCDRAPSIPPTDPEFEFGRHTQTQPYCDWTLNLEAVTIVGIYSNVVPGGHFEASQTEWLSAELGAAATDRPLIVAVHHPPYSVDSMHGGSAHIGEALDQAFDASGRTADLVLSGHVHDYQRFTRRRGEQAIPYVVIGNSGYHNLHVFAKGTKAGEEVGDGVTFEYGDASEYGFLKLTVAKGKISGEYSSVKPGTMPDGSDAKVTLAKDAF
jgi:3',5'-cyclic AMP phosphodiesterase CpdA